MNIHPLQYIRKIGDRASAYFKHTAQCLRKGGKGHFLDSLKARIQCQDASRPVWTVGIYRTRQQVTAMRYARVNPENRSRPVGKIDPPSHKQKPTSQQSVSAKTSGNKAHKEVHKTVISKKDGGPKIILETENSTEKKTNTVQKNTVEEKSAPTQKAHRIRSFFTRKTSSPHTHPDKFPPPPWIDTSAPIESAPLSLPEPPKPGAGIPGASKPGENPFLVPGVSRREQHSLLEAPPVRIPPAYQTAALLSTREQIRRFA